MILFCWQARSAFADLSSELLSPGRRLEVQSHLAECPACREAMAGQQTVASLLKEAASLSDVAARPATGRWNDPALFEQRVLLAARARRAAQEASLPSTLRPARSPFSTALPAAAALVMLLAAGVVAVGIRGVEAPPPARATGALSAAARLSSDSIAPTPEIPFTLRQDLVGSRSGSIPETTYVLEPAPWDLAVAADARVVRASF